MFRPKALGLSEPLSTREGKLTLLTLVMMLYVMALFLSIAVHELLGHALFATILGGDVYAFYLSPGSGFVSFWLPGDLSSAGIALIFMAGILVQIVIGSIVLFLVLPRIKNFLLGVFVLMFCIGMTVHSSLYLVMGYFGDSADTNYAATVLGMEPDPFAAAGLILAGVFVMAISVAGLKFMGRFMDLEDDGVRLRMMALLWFPPFLLSGIISLVYSLSLPKDQMAYPLMNSVAMMLFLGMAIFLAPSMVEPVKGTEHRVSLSSVLALTVCFMLAVAGWAGVFGLSQETARGVLLHDPPVEVENYYRDYSLGNAALHVYANGTVRVDIVLRNRMESPSPLEDRIYHTFDDRPDWERYIARSQNLLTTMFDLERGAAENLSYGTSIDTIWAAGSNDTYGRMCTTYMAIGSATRQVHVSPGVQTPQPGMGILDGDYAVSFIDPWASQARYLDKVTISWDTGLELVELAAWSALDPSISPLRIGDNEYAWENLDGSSSPTNYRVILNGM